MNKKIILLMSTSLTFSYANDFQVLVNQKNNIYKIGNSSIQQETTEWTNYQDPFNCIYDLQTSDFYYDKSFSSNGVCEQQQKRDIISSYISEDGQKHIIKTESVYQTIESNVVHVLTGTHLEASCKDILSYDLSFLNKDGEYKIKNNSENVFCDMTRENGGWTLVGIVANDNNNYWTFASDAYYNPINYGSLSNRTLDYQSEAWGNIKAEDLMLTDLNKSKYLIYDTVLNDETLSSKYNGNWINSPTYTINKKQGSWSISSCSNQNDIHMRTFSLDSDSSYDHIHASHSRGFIFMSLNNSGCSWDDTMGGFNTSSNTNSSIQHNEYYHTNGFQVLNFSTSNPMQIFIR